MAETRLTMVRSASAPDAGRWVRQLRAAWQVRGGPVSIDHRPMAAWLGESEPVREAEAVVAVLGREDSPATLWKVIDLLHRRLLPGVVLVPEPQADALRLSGDGVYVEGWEVDASWLAATLHALAQRQAMVCALARELSAATEASGGVGLQIARLHDELNLAAAVQRDLLPSALPQIPGAQLRVLFRPAGYVSGDIYDARRLDEHRIGFFLADAVGHGVPAALMTMLIARGLSQPDSATGLPRLARPAQALEALNRELMATQRGTARFATAVCGTFDVRDGTVTMAIAGHPPPLCFSRDGWRRLDAGGALLGVFAEERYEPVQLTLRPGQTLLIHSDGFEQACPEPDQPSRASDRYLTMLAALPWPGCDESGSLDRAMEELAEQLDAQAGSLHPGDDITAIAIAPTGAAVGARARAA